MNNEWMLYTQHYPISGEFSEDSLEPQVIVGFNKKLSIYVVLLKKIWVCSMCTKHHSLCNWEPVLLYISHFGQHAICVVQYKYIIWFTLEKYTAGKKKKKTKCKVYAGFGSLHVIFYVLHLVKKIWNRFYMFDLWSPPTEHLTERELQRSQIDHDCPRMSLLGAPAM